MEVTPPDLTRRQPAGRSIKSGCEGWTWAGRRGCVSAARRGCSPRRWMIKVVCPFPVGWFRRRERKEKECGKATLLSRWFVVLSSLPIIYYMF